jgi:long-chain acyl-CoA synthetase
MTAEKPNQSVKSPIEMMYHWESETPDKVFLRQPTNLVWKEFTWREVASQVRRIAQFISSKGYPAGSRIAIWSSNSKDWVIADLAIMLSGHISIPIYPGQDVTSANYILEHSEARMMFIGAIDAAQNFGKVNSDDLQTVAMLGCKVDCDSSMAEIIEEHEPLTSSPVPNPEDMFTIIYTSGTTGNPKGVMHAHSTPGHVVPGLAKTFRMYESGSRFFSFLPMAHAAERIVVEMTAIYSNASISFSEGLATFGDEIRSVQPTFFFAVPRLWIKFKEGIDSKISPENQAVMTPEQNSAIAHQLGLGEARIILTGSAPCPVDVQEWFIEKGIILRDGYGMTENCVHGIAWTKDNRPKSGCVGQPMADDIEVRLTDEGEIQFRSKGLMKGYYRNPEKTAEVMDNGWYCTGDSGRIDEDGDIWVTGRISEVFKTSKGKFVVPSKIENLLGSANELAQYCVIGHGRTAPILLATLSEVGSGMERSTLKQRLESVHMQLNDQLNSWEKVSQFFITPEWTIENSLLTPTLKLKRKAIEDAYIAAIDETNSETIVAFLD